MIKSADQHPNSFGFVFVKLQALHFQGFNQLFFECSRI
jgi:hypothetical protein